MSLVIFLFVHKLLIESVFFLARKTFKYFKTLDETQPSIETENLRYRVSQTEQVFCLNIPPEETYFFYRLMQRPLFYAIIIVPVVLTLIRRFIQRTLQYTAKVPSPLQMLVDAVGLSLATYSEARFFSSAERVLMLFVAIYAFYVNLIFSGDLFDGLMTASELPQLTAQPRIVTKIFNR